MKTKIQAIIFTILLMCVPTVCFAADELSQPQDLKAQITETGYNLTWTADVVASYYEIYAGTSPGNLKKVKSLKNVSFGIRASTCEMLYITGRRPLFFAVRAVAGKQKSELSDVASQLAAPKNLLAVSGEDTVSLSWKPVKYADSYTVRATIPGREPISITTKTTSYDLHDEALGGGKYSVCANFGGQPSEYCAAKGISGPIKNFTVSAENGEVTLAWEPPDDEFTDLITGYRIYRASSETESFKPLTVVKETAYAEKTDAKSGYYIIVPLYGSIEGEYSQRKGYTITFPDDLPHTTQTGTAKYLVVVDKGAQKVQIYGKDKQGLYTVLQKDMICSTGRYTWTTPAGKFTLGKRVVWRDFGNAYAKYATYFSPSLMIHSVLYSKKNDSAVIQSSVSGLGTPQSAGCVRLLTSDAKWIYDNCPEGTIVEIVAGKAK